MTTTGARFDLPDPSHRRWQPLRLGLVDLFFYDYQEFWFRDGRLLLRGNNGTGKSKVLALTLPFLLDGRCVPARVEPDGDAQKRVEWNLLLGDRYNERTGYTWIEFGCLHEDGRPEFVTIGCGMKAVRGRPLTTWFFVTERRVARDLFLLEAKRTLGRDRLREALGERGDVFDTAARYRLAVDEKLFQLGPVRYEALLSLLIQLRQPQLSRRPDERALSQALTEALPPLDAGVLREVADAFRNLEAERRELDGLREAATAVDRFRTHHGQYARIVARRRATRVRTAHSRYEKLSAELGRAREERQRAHDDEGEIVAAIEHTRGDLVAGRARERTLRESPEMRSAQALHRSEEDAREKTKAAETTADDLNTANAANERVQRRCEMRSERCARTRKTIEQGLARLAAHAAQAGIDDSHRGLLGELALPDGSGEVRGGDARITTARSTANALHGRRAEQIAHLQTLLDALDNATQARLFAQQHWQEVNDAIERSLENKAEAERAVGAAIDSLRANYARWLDGSREFRFSDPEAVLARFEGWASSLDAENPVTAAARAVFDVALGEIAANRASHAQDKQQAEVAREELLAELQRLEAGEDRAPPVPYTRREKAREGKLGAPLWTLVDFRDGIAPAERAGVEAALESAGLLDAWVAPGGEVHDADTWDIVLVAGVDSPSSAALTADEATPIAEPSLKDILLAAVDPADARASAVADETIDAVLGSIGLGESQRDAWVDGDGRWRLGPGRGAWGKPQADYIGRGAREAARRRRLVEIAAEIAVLDERIADSLRALLALDTQRARLDAEWRALPDDEPLRGAHRSVAELQRVLAEQRQRAEQANQRLAAARAEAGRCEAERDAAAVDLHLPAQRHALAEVRQALTEYDGEARALWPAIEGHWDGLATLAEARAEVEQTLAEIQLRTERCAAAQLAAREAAAERDALRDTVGDAVAAVRQRLAETSATIATLETRQQTLDEQRLQVTRRRSAAATEVVQFGKALIERDERRQEAIARLVELVDLGLLAAAFSDGEVVAPVATRWSPDWAVQLARSIEKALQQVDDGDPAWQAQQRLLSERIAELQAALSRHGHDAGVELHDDLYVVRIVFQARSCDVEELAQLLAGEARERGELLDARERDLLEEHLVNDLASHLQTRIQEAEVAAERMNEELERRPTGAGMKLRLRWKPLADGESWAAHTAPDGLNEARRRLLRQSAAVWSPEDRRAVGAFLKKCIDDARAAEEAAGLGEVLENALDYRYWHRFLVERWQDGSWRPAHGPASGGERALVVTIPLFAAASSHYSSAGSHAPRLVLLDEAFAGIDDDSRSKCLGLLAHFDMDVVMTSEREWGCYAEVPGLAIAQLTRREGVDAVHVSPWWWDGRRRVRAEERIPDLETLERASAGS